MEISKSKLLFLLWFVISAVIGILAVATDPGMSWGIGIMVFFIIWVLALIPAFLLAALFDEGFLSKKEEGS